MDEPIELDVESANRILVFTRAMLDTLVEEPSELEVLMVGGQIAWVLLRYQQSLPPE